MPQNQWEQFAWHGIRKRSWQTEQTSSSGGTADADEEELISPSPFPAFASLSPTGSRAGTRLRCPRGVMSPRSEVVGDWPWPTRLGALPGHSVGYLSVVRYEATQETPTLSNLSF